MSHVLIVDGDTRVRAQLHDALTGAGLQVTTAGSASHALQFLKSNRPDCVLVGLRVPSLSGLQTIRQIRAFDQDLPVVALGDVGKPPASAQALAELGVEIVVPKTLDVESLLAALRPLIERSTSAPAAPARRLTGTILVVDDDPSIVKLFKFFFEKKGLRVLTASSGAEALRALAQQALQLVLLDVNMPGMDGLVTLQKIQASYPKLPVIIVSGVEEEESGIEALRSGAYDYVVKPVDLAHLEQLVSTKLQLEDVR